MPASPELKRQLFATLKYLYLGFLITFAIGYLGPVVLDERFQARSGAAIAGTAWGVGSSLLIFWGLHKLLLSERDAAREFLDVITASKFNSVKAFFAGVCIGGISGLVYPVTGYILPFIGRRSIDSALGGFYWAPIGAVYVFAIVSTWCYMKKSCSESNEPALRHLNFYSWVSGLVASSGFWLLVAFGGIFPSRRGGIVMSTPYSWTTLLPLYVIFAGFVGVAVFVTRRGRIEQNIKDRRTDSIDDLNVPFSSTTGSSATKHLVQHSPDFIRIVPTLRDRIGGWLFMFMAFIVYVMVAILLVYAPGISEGYWIVLLLITPFFIIGFLFETVPRRFVFDRSRGEFRYGNIWTRRTRPLSDVKAVQVINGQGWSESTQRDNGRSRSGPNWQLNLIMNDTEEPRLQVWDHGDHTSTQAAAKSLSMLLGAPLRAL